MSQVTKNTTDKIDSFPKGFVFTYDDFISEVGNKEANFLNWNDNNQTGYQK